MCLSVSKQESAALRRQEADGGITEDSGRPTMFKTCGQTEPWRTDRPSAGKRGEAQPTAAEQDQDLGLPKWGQGMFLHGTWAVLCKRTACLKVSPLES